MPSQYENLPDLMGAGIDVSRKEGALMLCSRIRRYWAERGWDVPVRLVMSETGVRTEVIEKGRQRTIRETIYGPKADVTNARRLTEDEKLDLLACIDAGLDMSNYTVDYPYPRFRTIA